MMKTLSGGKEGGLDSFMNTNSNTEKLLDEESKLSTSETTFIGGTLPRGFE